MLPPVPRAAALQVPALFDNEDRVVVGILVCYCTQSSIWRPAQRTWDRPNALKQIVRAKIVNAWISRRSTRISTLIYGTCSCIVTRRSVSIIICVKRFAPVACTRKTGNVSPLLRLAPYVKHRVRKVINVGVILLTSCIVTRRSVSTIIYVCFVTAACT